MISDAERVNIEVNISPQDPPDEADITLLLRPFHLFDGTQELELHSDHPLDETHYSPTMRQEAIPPLRVLWLNQRLNYFQKVTSYQSR